jgi:MtrB/PioB family decaheme-associated outer membrane protein
MAATPPPRAAGASSDKGKSMRKIPAALVLTALAAAVPAALAQQVTGWVSLGGIGTDVTGDNPWKLHEYRDLDDGVIAGFRLRADSGSWYTNLFGENLGRDDQFIELRGGRYGVFKYGVYGDDVVHNWTFGAITPFNGVGSNNLTFAGASASTDISTWNRFDYGIQHKNVGAFAEATAGVDSPFYFRVTSNRKRTDGLRPLGQPGTSPGGPVYEMPLPVDWTQTDVGGEVGYSSKTMHISVSALVSKFRDNNDFLNWRSPIIATGANTEWSTISADNELKRIGANAVFRKLPMNSTLALRATRTTIENSLPVQPSWISVSGTTGNVRLSNPSSSTFEGDVENTSASAALNTNWARGLDSKIYYNYYERDNKSHHIVFTPSGPGSGGTCDVTAAAVALTTCTTEFLHFEKKNFGVEVGWRLNPANRLTAGIDYMDTERERFDFDRAKETKYSLEWKSGMLGGVDTRVKYIHMKRDSEFLLGDYPNLFERYTYRFDVAPLDRDQLKVTFDFSPAAGLDLGADFIYKRNQYKDVVFGRDKDTRGEVNLSASYGDAQVFRVTGFFDYERVRYDSNHWVGAITTYPNPNTAGTAYPWSADVRDKNYLIGAAADWAAMPRLKVSVSAIYQKTDGTVDFQSLNNLGNPMAINNFENVKKTTLNVKGTYAVMKSLDVTLGAAYEKYDLDDVQFNDYIANIRTGTTQNYLSGAYAYGSYKASIVYAYLTYRF